GRVTVWDIAAGRPVLTLPGAGFLVRSVAFSPDGRTLATGESGGHDCDARLRFWDAATGRLRAEAAGHLGGVTSMAFSPDGRTLLTAGWLDERVRWWDAPTG
ncbi:MAG: WD40 repeat domain-containing protein, partial [Gemmataceae bacterium]